MNDYYFLQPMPRNQTLIIVEGKGEKEELLYTLLTLFPEVPIQLQDIHVYGTHIYDLYNEIVKEYGNDWYVQQIDIDLPYILFKKHGDNSGLRKRDVTNTILMFDYERHEHEFSAEKILHLQNHFNDITGEGILYINYPMIESYKHVLSVPDNNFVNRSIPTTCKPGSQYKALVDNESAIAKYFDGFQSIAKKLGLFTNNAQQEKVQKMVRALTEMGKDVELRTFFLEILLKNDYSAKKAETLSYSFSSIVNRVMEAGDTSLYMKMRSIILYLAKINIIKADAIQNGTSKSGKSLKEVYYNLEWVKILEQQNLVSKDDNTGFIWVLCTCLTFICEYKFFFAIDDI